MTHFAYIFQSAIHYLWRRNGQTGRSWVRILVAPGYFSEQKILIRRHKSPVLGAALAHKNTPQKYVPVEAP